MELETLREENKEIKEAARLQQIEVQKMKEVGKKERQQLKEENFELKKCVKILILAFSLKFSPTL